MIRFDSDYLEGCHPSILERLGQTNLEQTPGYGEDPHCERAAGMIRDLCKAPEAAVHFLVGGTQTNATVISSALKPYQGVLCADTGHINVHETGAVEHSGHKVLALPSSDAKISVAQVEEWLSAHERDCNREHCVQAGILYLTLPTELGTVWTLKELEDMREVCDRFGIPLFIDGARLGYGLASKDCDVTLPDLARLADVFYIGGTKQGALFGEAVVITSDALKKDFRYNMKQNGAMLAKGRLLGIQFEALMEDGLYFRLSDSADRLAERVRAAFSKAGCEFFVRSSANLAFPILTDGQIKNLSQDFGFEIWQELPLGRKATRFCTSWATTPRQVEALEKAIAAL